MNDMSNVPAIAGATGLPTRVYLAGPMRGYWNFNAPAFERAAATLRAQGFEVFSPSEHSLKLFGDAVRQNAKGDESAMGGDQETIGRTVFHLDLTFICLRAAAIALLPGWENSKGAFAEWACARALGLKIIYLGDD